MWWITVGLIIAGVVFMLIEMLLIPGVGVAGIFSLGAMIAASWYSFECISPAAGWWVTVGQLAALVLMVVFILRKKTWKRFELKDELTSKVNQEPESLSVGERGVTVTRLAPMGNARFEKLACEVKSYNNSMVDPGVEVEIVAVENNQVLVKPIKQ